MTNTSADHNPPAFPHGSGTTECSNCGWHVATPSTGMSLRDWFAGQALDRVLGVAEQRTAGIADADIDGALKAAATTAYRIADAMLAARRQS